LLLSKIPVYGISRGEPREIILPKAKLARSAISWGKFSLPILLLAWFFVWGGPAKAADVVITADTVWSKGEVRVIDGDEGLAVMPGAKLTIEAGVIIKLAPNNAIMVMGELDIQGSAVEPVIITSLKDDSAGGDTNGDGNSAAPAPGDWHGIFANSPDARIEIDYARISYGGGYFDNESALLAINQAAELNLSHSQIVNNKGLIAINQALVAKINYSNIFNPDFCLDQDPFGMEIPLTYCGGPTVFYNGATALDASNNYWGHEAGPTLFEQMSGQSDIKGTAISGNINYQPFLTSPWLAEPAPAEPEPVILIPGILGSWNISGRWQIDPIFHTYDNLMEALIAAGYRESSLGQDQPTLFTFPYDWRADNNITAGLLKEKIRQVKEITGADKVDLVAHSMGGLVARSYIQGDGYQDDVDQVIFLGTPHLGAVESYLKYEGAYFQSNFVPLQKYLFQVEAATQGYLDLTDYIRVQVPTVEQLLPIYDYLKDKQPDDSWQLRPYPLNYPQNNYLEQLNSQANTALLNQRVDITNIVSDLGADSTLNYLKVIADPDTTDNQWQSGYPEDLDNNLMT